jgi:precorrin-2 dehydrogenase / sirohydrochlorin ferrochelatase
MKRKFLPISIDISDEKILVIGGGKSALKKIQILQRTGANIEVVAQEIIAEVYSTGVKCVKKTYEKTDLVGYLMLYSCTNCDELDRQIAKDGRELGVLVNIHDKPELCQFVSPAIYQDGNISVAVSSNAENVQESIRVRNVLKEFLENQKKQNK